MDPAQLGFEFQTGRLQNLFVRMSHPPSGQQSTKILLCSKYFKPLILPESANLASLLFHIVVGPLSRVRPRNGILGLVVVVVLLPLRSEFIGEL